MRKFRARSRSRGRTIAALSLTARWCAGRGRPMRQDDALRLPRARSSRHARGTARHLGGCGAGGFSAGAVLAGCRIALACDSTRSTALETHAREITPAQRTCARRGTRALALRDGRHFHLHGSPPVGSCRSKPAAAGSIPRTSRTGSRRGSGLTRGGRLARELAEHGAGAEPAAIVLEERRRAHPEWRREFETPPIFATWACRRCAAACSRARPGSSHACAAARARIAQARRSRRAHAARRLLGATRPTTVACARAFAARRERVACASRRACRALFAVAGQAPTVATTRAADLLGDTRQRSYDQSVRRGARGAASVRSFTDSHRAPRSRNGRSARAVPPLVAGSFWPTRRQGRARAKPLSPSLFS